MLDNRKVQTRAVLFALLLFAIVTIIGLLLPLTISATTDARNVPNEMQNGTTEGFSSASTVQISNLSDTEVKLALPELSFPEVFTSEKAQSLKQYSSACDCLVITPGDQITIEGVFGDFRILSLDSSNSDIRIERIQQTETSELLASAKSQVIEIPSLFVTTWTTTNLFEVIQNPHEFQGQNLAISTPNERIELADPNTSRLIQSASGIVIIEISHSALLWIALLFCVLACWLIGTVILSVISQSKSHASSIKAWVGLLCFALILSSLSYFTSVLNASLWLSLASAILIALFLIKQIKTRTYPVLPVGDLRQFSSNYFKVFVVTALSFPVTLLFGSGFFGEYKTDFYDYSFQSASMRAFSLPELWVNKAIESPQSSDPLFGWNLRSIDTAMASAISILTRDTNQALVFLALLIFALGVLAVMNIYRTLSKGKSANLLLLLLLCSTSISGLFAESYFSQYIFVIALFALVDSYLLFRNSQTDAGNFFYFAIVNAFLICIYPYFWIIAAGALLVHATIEKGWKWLISGRQLLLYGVIALFVNISVIPFINFRETNIYNERLNEIANLFLLSPFNKFQLLSLGFGGLSYEWRHGQESPPEGAGPLGQAAWEAGKFLYWNPWVGIGIIFVVVLLILSTLRKFPISASLFKDFLPIVMIFVGFLIAGIFFSVQGGTYAAFKFFWTAAALLPLIIICIAAVVPSKITNFLVPGLLIPLFLLVTFANSGVWLLNMNSQSASTSHASAVLDVNRFKNYLSESSPEKIVFIDGEQFLRGSDRDRVLLNQLIVATMDQQIPWINCTGEKKGGCSLEQGDTIVSIGKSKLDFPQIENEEPIDFRYISIREHK